MSATLTATAAMEKTVVAPKRVQSVDVLRGLTIALMILVNDPGDWGHVFKPLDHAEWNGWTLTDLVFPTFLFLVGASLVFSLESRAAKGDCWKTMLGQLFARTGKILLLEFVLVYFPRMHWNGMRIYGVLTRIALCYLLAGLVMIGTLRVRARVRVILGVIAVLLLGYWVALRWVPVPGLGMPGRDVAFMDKDANLTSWLDRAVSGWSMQWLHVGKLYHKTRDPEGLLSTLPATATVLLGALAGMWMRRRRDQEKAWRLQTGLAVAGMLGVVAGEVWSVWFPINKNLWTSSYVLLSAGWAALALAGLSWLMDGRKEPWPLWLRVATWPWLVFGSNAIAAFPVSVVLVKGMLYYHVTNPDGYKNTVWTWIYEHVFATGPSTEWTSVAFAVSFVAVCFLPNWWLWRRKWFLKI